MTPEEKLPLIKDLCARLFCLETWVRYEDKDYIITGYGRGRVLLLSSPFSSASGPCPLIGEVKPYLRPMSSMTEDEKREFDDFCVIDEFAWNGNSDIGYKNQAIIMSDAIDWLNTHHFDYRGLIEKGLAIEAPEGMYKEN